MTEHVLEESLKQLEVINANYPKMDLKPLGGGSKTKFSRSSSMSNNDAVQEDEKEGKEEGDESNQAMNKSKFKHVNIMTDSDEFNLHKASEQNNGLNIPQSQRMKSTSTDQAFGESIQEGKVEEEQDTLATKMAISKLGIANQAIEESIMVDRGEFDCSTPTRPKNTSLLKKIGSNIHYSQYSNKEEIITEDPEKETDCLYVNRITSHKEIKIIVDEIDNEKSKSYTPHVPYMESSVPIIEETKEEEILEGNKEFQLAKHEREQEKEKMKKIIKGVQMSQEGEQLMHMAQSSGITSHMKPNSINENQQGEDQEDDEVEVKEIFKLNKSHQ